MSQTNQNKSIGANAVLNVIRQMATILLPLITYPYLIRKIGADGMGKVNYVNSIVGYFLMVAMLGIQSYSIRQGAHYRDDKKKYQTFACQIIEINVIFMIIAYIAFYICIFTIPNFSSYRVLFLIEGTQIFFTVFSIDWVNTTFEDFKIITIRTITCNIISLILILTLIHGKNDINLYAVILMIPYAITCITNWIYCRRYIKFKFVYPLKLSVHIKPLFILFANAAAVSIYVNADVIMLGWLKGDFFVGVYTIAVKVYNIVKNLLAAIYNVAIPRLASYFSKREFSKFKQVFTDLWGNISVLLLPSGIGIICVAQDIMLFLGGKDLVQYALILQILGGSLIFAIYGGLITTCLNLTINREKNTLIATVGGALINVGLNIIIIPRYSFYGAALTTLISEFFVFLYSFLSLPEKSNYINFQVLIISLGKTLLGCLAIILFSYIVHLYLEVSLIQFFIIVTGSIIIYSIVMLGLKDLYYTNFFISILKKIHLK